MKSPFDVSSNVKKRATEHSAWTPCGNYMTFKALLIDLVKNPTPDRIHILQLWCFFFFLSLAGWYLSCWCLEGGSGSWQTCSKWNISTSLSITPHTSYQHPGSNTAFSCWESKRAPPDRKQKEGAASHCRISYLTTEKGRVWLWWHALCWRWSATKRLLWKLTGHSLPQGTAFPAADFPLSHLREIVCSYLVSNRPSVKHYVKSALSTGGRVWRGGQCRRQVSPSWLSPSCRHLWQGPPVYGSR